MTRCELVKFKMAPSLKGPNLEGDILVNPNHVTAVKWLENQEATAIFCSNFQIIVDSPINDALIKLGMKIINETNNQEEK